MVRIPGMMLTSMLGKELFKDMNTTLFQTVIHGRGRDATLKS